MLCLLYMLPVMSVRLLYKIYLCLLDTLDFVFTIVTLLCLLCVLLCYILLVCFMCLKLYELLLFFFWPFDATMAMTKQKQNKQRCGPRCKQSLIQKQGLHVLVAGKCPNKGRIQMLKALIQTEDIFKCPAE